MVLLAVYGTLRRGALNNSYYLCCSKYCGQERIKGVEMFSCNVFPYAVVTDSKQTIKVDLYNVNKETLKELDIFEGYPFHYDRVKVITSKGKAWMYVVHKVPTLPKVTSGDWMAQ